MVTTAVKVGKETPDSGAIGTRKSWYLNRRDSFPWCWSWSWTAVLGGDPDDVYGGLSVICSSVG